jgi:peptidoglycan hydrolase CwlO-like protein
MAARMQGDLEAAQKRIKELLEDYEVLLHESDKARSTVSRLEREVKTLEAELRHRDEEREGQQRRVYLSLKMEKCRKEGAGGAEREGEEDLPL